MFIWEKSHNPAVMIQSVMKKKLSIFIEQCRFYTNEGCVYVFHIGSTVSGPSLISRHESAARSAAAWLLVMSACAIFSWVSKLKGWGRSRKRLVTVKLWKEVTAVLCQSNLCKTAHWDSIELFFYAHCLLVNKKKKINGKVWNLKQTWNVAPKGDGKVAYVEKRCQEATFQSFSINPLILHGSDY